MAKKQLTLTVVGSDEPTHRAVIIPKDRRTAHEKTQRAHDLVADTLRLMIGAANHLYESHLSDARKHDVIEAIYSAHEILDDVRADLESYSDQS